LRYLSGNQQNSLSNLVELRINSFGQWVERSEQVNLNELFERMTREELEAYASNATLPEWFTRTVGATAPHSPDPESDS